MDEENTDNYAQQEKAPPRPAVGEHGKETLQKTPGCETKRVKRVRQGSTLQNWGRDTPLLGGHNSIIPRFSAMVTAWVRSLALSLERMFLTWPFTVSSVIES